jgi:outer membrane protein assembly factor BamB
MKRLLLILVTIVATSCSFDNKTGLWKDTENIPIDNSKSKTITDNNPKTRYENVFIKNKTFNEEKESLNISNIKIDAPIKVVNWLEQYAAPTNNISNFSYSANKILLYKSSKLSKFSSSKNYVNRNIVFYKNNLISYDQKGRIFIYSINLKKKIFEYNFYKKNFKNFNKEIYFVVNKNILYAADNLGFLYALNLENNSIKWAKNYGIPFRSNLKFKNNQIFLANQDNVIYSIDSNTGDKNWEFATSLTFLKTDFKNNLALDLVNNNLFFLNTSGELYSISYLNKKINFVLNFKNSSLAGDTELFLSNPIVIKNNNLIITTEKAVLSYNIITAERNWILPAEPIFKPIITSNYSYVVLKNNFLICLDNTNGNVIWSKNIITNLERNEKEMNLEKIVDFKIVNSEIYIFYKNGYLLSFNSSNGNLNYLSRISKKGIGSEIVFLNDNMLFIDNDNKLLKFN